MLEIAGADIDGEGQEYPDADWGDFRSPHIVSSLRFLTAVAKAPNPFAVRKDRSRALFARFLRLSRGCRGHAGRGGLAESFPPAIHPPRNLHAPAGMNTVLFLIHPGQARKGIVVCSSLALDYLKPDTEEAKARALSESVSSIPGYLKLVGETWRQTAECRHNCERDGSRFSQTRTAGAKSALENCG